MKAHIKENTAKKSGILLTIGMIVKNEEKGLAKCLEAIAPLRNAIPCELIITDTGSTDGTVAIAEKYADRLLHFKWCNDFSAARNTAIDVMRGEWFMYLDADEIFDDSILKIADFFTSGAYKSYVCAAYVQRNYFDFQHNDYSDYYAVRLRRNDSFLRFSGTIHEQFPACNPISNLSAVAHHDGYINMLVGNLLRCKPVRNRPLIEKAIKENPNSPRLYRHLADCFIVKTSDCWNEKAECLKKGIEAEAEFPSESYLGSIQLELAKLYTHMSRDADLRLLLSEWFNQPHPALMADCELRYIAGQQAFTHKNYSEALNNFHEYLLLYKKYLDNTLEISVNAIPINYATPEGAATANAMLAVCCAMLNDEKQARLYMRAAEPEKALSKTGKPLLLDLFMQYADAVCDRELFKDVFCGLYSIDKSFAELFILSFEARFCYTCPTKTAYLSVLSEVPAPAVACWAKMCLNKTAEEADFEKILGLPCRPENECYAEAFFYSLAFPKTAERFFTLIPSERAQNLAVFIKNRHVNFARAAFGYLSSCKETQDLNILYWRWTLSGEALISDNDFTDDEWNRLLRLYCRNGAAYCRTVYSPQVWCDEQINLLPPSHSYIYFLETALSKKDGNDPAGYLKYLRLGLERYDKMKEVSEYLLKCCQDEIKKADDELSRQQSEMQLLQKQIKDNIRTLIKSGEAVQAKALLDRYKIISPDDADIKSLEALI